MQRAMDLFVGEAFAWKGIEMNLMTGTFLQVCLFILIAPKAIKIHHTGYTIFFWNLPV
jgi:hypothetical protein